MKGFLPYDPGTLPTAPSPAPGEQIELNLLGFPPAKKRRRAFRRPGADHYDRFVRLRQAAQAAMGGRAWSHGGIQLNLTIRAPELEPGCCLIAYLGGIMDSLDGGHGPNFTYLPIVYEDDCQICDCVLEHVTVQEVSYTVRLVFV